MVITRWSVCAELPGGRVFDFYAVSYTHLDVYKRQVEPDPAHVHPDWDLGAMVRTMSDFNLIVAPVMNPEHGEILGVVTVDDVLELLLLSLIHI